MKLTATLYTGLPRSNNEGYQFVYRKRIYESKDRHIELIDSISRSLEMSDSLEYYEYNGGDCEANFVDNTEMIDIIIWQEYCDKLARYLKENNIINLKTN